jgi:TPR repeat protein
LPQPYFYLALTCWQTNEITKAKEYFQKAIKLGNPEAEDALSEMLEELKEDAKTSWNSLSLDKPVDGSYLFNCSGRE